jgi:septal ring factor EnvC (AmiA/AmiB activator)
LNAAKRRPTEEGDMNKKRREAIDDLVNKINEIKEAAESLRDEEQEAFDNMPESLQQGDKGQAMEEAISNLDDAVNALEEAISGLESARG